MKQTWMKRAERWARRIAAGLEILHWAAAATALIWLVLALTSNRQMAEVLSSGASLWGDEMKTYGFELQVVYDGQADLKAAALFSGGAAVILSLMAMVFRNIRLILKAARPQEGEPLTRVFQPDVVRMVREIGIFYLSVPAAGLAAINLARLVLGVERCEASLQLGGIFTGLVVLCLSQVFAYGVRLQSDVDGLI